MTASNENTNNIDSINNQLNELDINSTTPTTDNTTTTTDNTTTTTDNTTTNTTTTTDDNTTKKKDEDNPYKLEQFVTNSKGETIDTTTTTFYDEIEIEDMEFNEEERVFYYPCPCGDRFRITEEDILNGEEVAMCPSCSLLIKVIYSPDDFIIEEVEN